MFKILGYQGKKKTSLRFPLPPFKMVSPSKQKTRCGVGKVGHNPYTLLVRTEVWRLPKQPKAEL